jgi:hypothetical protein
MLTSHIHQIQRFRMSGAISLLPHTPPRRARDIIASSLTMKVAAFMHQGRLCSDIL